MSKILEVVLSLWVLVFVFSSRLATGLSLTVARIIEPLHNARLVILALVADFGPGPVPAYLTVKAHRPNRTLRQR